MEFRPLARFPELLISSSGEIWNDRWKKILKPTKNCSGFLAITVTDPECVERCVTVHRLVKEAFDPHFCAENIVYHLDGDRTNNNFHNLAQVSRKRWFSLFSQKPRPKRSVEYILTNQNGSIFVGTAKQFKESQGFDTKQFWEMVNRRELYGWIGKACII